MFKIPCAISRVETSTPSAHRDVSREFKDKMGPKWRGHHRSAVHGAEDSDAERISRRGLGYSCRAWARRGLDVEERRYCGRNKWKS